MLCAKRNHFAAGFPYVGFCGHPAGESSKSCCRPYGVVSSSR